MKTEKQKSFQTHKMEAWWDTTVGKGRLSDQALGITRKPTKQNDLGNRYGMTRCRDDNGKDEGQTKE